MVQVQSTWFPLIDLNPQIFVPNIYKAAEGDFHKATIRIFRSGRYSSNLEFPRLKQEVGSGKAQENK